MKFDFIIIHESAHVWFANSITYKDIADMWIHESFGAYSENLFLDYHYGKQASSEYVIGTRERIKNDRQIIGKYNVNFAGSGDMYYKGANMLHILRQLVGNDERWRFILRGINKEFYHQTLTTEQIENYLSKAVGKDLQPFFDQYLRDIRIPIFEYTMKNNLLKYRWNNCIKEFNMPVNVLINGVGEWLSPSAEWQEKQLTAPAVQVVIDPDFYVASFNLTGKTD